MSGFEKLGLFYIGRRYDLATGTTGDEPVLYDSRDLVTHAVCVGMTGSGKTGLGIGLIEEAAIDGIPVLAIDPKGDLGNLLLTFPGTTGAEFRPWISEDDARRAGLSADAYAGQEAEKWKSGLVSWGQDGARIERLRQSAEFAIYTPGSRSGRPISILGSFAAPPPAERQDTELLTERASGTATSTLVLAGVDAPPRSREHTLVTMLLAEAWRRGADLDLASLIRQVQSPAFDRVGVVDLESFFPARERFDLAMRLNGVLAAPGFETWLAGDPLDPDALLYTSGGRPRVAVLTIAHLGEAERMFFVSLLLTEVVTWVRRQTGTSSLRALLYMDEIHGYFPPVANPPSKPPLLTLLKQSRAVGLGVVLATQNPVDLDYKGLANTGTWFLGRLQTERDKARVLEGLEGIAGGLDRAEADRILSSLGKRIFLMHNVHDAGPTVFETRWTLSYLRGPLSRDQIKALQPAAPASAAAVSGSAAAQAPGPSAQPARAAERPVVPPGVQEFFLPAAAGGRPVYRPAVVGAARVRFSDRALGLDSARSVLYLTPIDDEAIHLDWSRATQLTMGTEDLLRGPEREDAEFAALPAIATQPRKYAAWEKAFSRWLAQNEKLDILRHPTLRIASRPDESERDFRIRLRHEAHVGRDEAIETVRKKYAARQAALAERLRRAEVAVDREQQQVSDSRLQTAVSMGATLLGALFGRKTLSTGSLGRATTTARGVGRTMKEASDVKRAEEGVETVKAAMQTLEQQIAADVEAVTAQFDPDAPLETIAIAPKRGQVEVQVVALAWRPDRPAPATGAAPEAGAAP